MGGCIAEGVKIMSWNIVQEQEHWSCSYRFTTPRMPIPTCRHLDNQGRLCKEKNCPIAISNGDAAHPFNRPGKYVLIEDGSHE